MHMLVYSVALFIQPVALQTIYVYITSYNRTRDFHRLPLANEDVFVPHSMEIPLLVPQEDSLSHKSLPLWLSFDTKLHYPSPETYQTKKL